MSKTKSISVTETAKLIRRSLNESFPDVKFTVRCAKYAGGASIHVGWVDGPSTLQVEAITSRFQATYYDTLADCWRPLRHRLAGETVHLGSSIVQCHRQHSDAWCADAIHAIYAQHQALLSARGVVAPTVRDFLEGRLHAVALAPPDYQREPDPSDIPFSDGAASTGYPSLMDEVIRVLNERTAHATPETSATALSVTVAASDNPSAFLADAGWERVAH